MTEQTYSRLDLAKEQLVVALDLFLEKRSYASSITLAGASEEIFGKELLRQGKTPVLDWKFNQMGVVHQLLHGVPLKRKDFVKEENRIRNSMKHFDEKDNPQIAVDLEEAACWILVRACENASKLDIAIGRFEEFDEWFYKNIVGI
jgi:hypothetical protein